MAVVEIPLQLASGARGPSTVRSLPHLAQDDREYSSLRSGEFARDDKFREIF